MQTSMKYSSKLVRITKMHIQTHTPYALQHINANLSRAAVMTLRERGGHTRWGVHATRIYQEDRQGGWR
jgi:hypothetical protein